MRPPVSELDATAFGELLRDHDPAMRGLASSMLRRSSAVDDVLQDAYLKAFRARRSFRGDAAFSTWLYQIVYRTCLDHLRRVRPVDSLDEFFERRRQHQSEGEERFALVDALRRAINTLSPEHRAVVALVDGEGYSYEETAAILGISPGTVASRTSRARAALREAYTTQNPDHGFGGFHPGGGS